MLWIGMLLLAGMSSTARAAEPLSFARDVAPALTKAGCNMGACHGSFQGRGGMSLSLLGFNPAADYDVLFKHSRGRRIVPAAADQSLLLLKATGKVPHGGGRRLAEDSEGYRLLRDYISQGMPLAKAEPTVTSIEVTPPEVTIGTNSNFKIQVTALWSDGRKQDATPWALYDTPYKTRLEVDSTGGVRTLEAGKTPVSVRYMGQVAAVMVSVPFGKVETAVNFTPRNKVDEIVAKEWRRLGLKPAPLCDDATYLRRVTLDVIGCLPTPDEVQTFLGDQDPKKRARVVDDLLKRAEYVDYWSLRWGDLLRVHRRYLGEKGLAAANGWLRRAMRDNMPLDQMTRELLTSQGSLYANGPVAYYFIDSKPEELAETTAQVFLGVRLQCTRCHHHPLEVWSQDDYYGLANCFTRMEIKENGDNGRYGGARLLRASAEPNKKRKALIDIAPSILGAKLDANSVDIRRELADTMTSPENPFFARNLANRYWAWLTGRGLVEPVDDIRATNPPTIPVLFDLLAKELSEHQFDARHLIRMICDSHVYQLASEVNPSRDADGSLYTHRVPRRFSAEVLLDAINQVTLFDDDRFDNTPKGTKAIALPDPSIKSYFLDTFGRPARNSACECARPSGPDLAQALHLLNGPTLQDRITGPNRRVGLLVSKGKPDGEITEQLYLAALGRRPTVDELKSVVELVASYSTKQEAYEDILWALMNTAEFSFNH